MSTRNIKLLLEYDGTRYRGWKAGKKDESSTISGKLGEVLRRMTEEDIHLFCGEKTETGVHARYQIAQFQTNSTLSLEEIKEYLNHYLPLDIAILNVEEAMERFHAELNPHQVTYEYHLLIGDVPDVFQRKYVDFRTDAPNVERMKEGAGLLIGKHDFKTFSAGKSKKSTIRDISQIKIEQKENRICIRITGNGFLKEMPQKMIAALLDVGYEVYDKEQLLYILEGKQKISGTCANKALFLTDVTYDGLVR